jgi:3-oxoacyl-[acyl-carrier-protein] synthase-3
VACNHRFGSIILGSGSYTPSRIYDNNHFAEYLDTSDEWIVPRTGIKERHIAEEGEATLGIAVKAGRAALEDAGLKATDIDAVLCCTATPEVPIPSTSCMIQHELGATNAAAMDVGAACAGLVYGIVTASSMIASGLFQRVLVIGAETLSRFTDYQDRGTCILFGDGGGAVVLGPTDDASRGILHCELGADGSGAKLIWVPAGGSALPSSEKTVAERLHYMRMNGREVYKFAVTKMQELCLRALEQTGHEAEELKLVIPHQSNLRIIESARNRLGLPLEKVAVNIDRYGNTSAASIGLALDEARRSGKLVANDLVLLVAFGAGLTWGSVLMRL